MGTVASKQAQTMEKNVTSHEPKQGGVGLAIVKRLLWLPGLLAFWLRSRRSRNLSKAQLDHELRLYAEMFPGGFLHYGYFDDPPQQAADVSFADLDKAQLRYAEELINLIESREHPVLDVGCGMGGLSFMLADQGFDVIPLTPDRHQVAHIQAKRPELKVIQGRFEEFVAAGYEQYFGTIITSESLQYLDLDVALPRIRKLLTAGGRWIVCDYFRNQDEGDTSGHVWDNFCAQLKAEGFEIRQEVDITRNILPTLDFASLMAERFVLPVGRYTEGKLASKVPVLHYLLESLFDRLRVKTDKGLRSIDAAHFAAHKRYMRLVIEVSDR